MENPVPQPFPAHREAVRAEWVDYNGHMNVAYYVMVFDHGTDAFLGHLGLGRDYRERTGHSVFVVEAHVTYLSELHAGDAVMVTTQFLGHDEKRLHFLHAMHRVDGGGAGALAATNELMMVHVDMATRKSRPFPADAVAAIDAVKAAQAHLPPPPQAGRAIGLKAGGRRRERPPVKEIFR